MTDATATATEAADSTATEANGGTKEQTFTQADVDKIVRDRLAQQAKNKFGDYDELKSKAEGAKTLEERFGDLEKRAADAEAKALRSDIAAKHGITAEDRDLFLTGTDEATLTAQAERLAAREADRKRQGNVARKEGNATTTGKDDGELRDFTRGLFGSAD